MPTRAFEAAHATTDKNRCKVRTRHCLPRRHGVGLRSLDAPPAHQSRLPQLDASVRVLYVAPPRFALTSRFRPRRLASSHLPSAPKRITRDLWEVGERLWVLQPLLPAPNRSLYRVAARRTDAWLGGRVLASMRVLEFLQPLLWSYSPLSGRLVAQLSGRALIYDVVDDYSALEHYRNRATNSDLVALDSELTSEADLVFATSQGLYDQRSRLNAHCLRVGNAADIELFAQSRTTDGVAPELVGVPDPIILFHGTLSSQKLDTALILELAARRPEWSFVLIGPETDNSARRALAGVPNVFLLGRRNQADPRPSWQVQPPLSFPIA